MCNSCHWFCIKEKQGTSLGPSAFAGGGREWGSDEICIPLTPHLCTAEQETTVTGREAQHVSGIGYPNLGWYIV